MCVCGGGTEGGLEEQLEKTKKELKAQTGRSENWNQFCGNNTMTNSYQVFVGFTWSRFHAVSDYKHQHLRNFKAL